MKSDITIRDHRGLTMKYKILLKKETCYTGKRRCKNRPKKNFSMKLNDKVKKKKLLTKQGEVVAEWFRVPSCKALSP